MSYQLDFTGSDINKIIDGRYHSPIQDCVGDNYPIGAPLNMTAATEYDFECNCNTRDFSVFPDHITNIWNGATNIATFGDFLNTPEIVANIQFTFDPTVAAAGNLTVRAYVNETTPIVIKDVLIPFKAVETKETALITFYAGDSTGFDVKNKGVYFTVESSANGILYDTAIEIYRT